MFALSLYSVSHKFTLAPTAHKGKNKGKKIPEITQDRVVLQAGFRSPNLSPEPIISISKPSKQVIKKGETSQYPGKQRAATAQSVGMWSRHR